MIQITLGILALAAGLLGGAACVFEKSKKDKVLRIIECIFFVLLGVNEFFK